MSTTTKIEWTRGDDGAAGATWNPVTGCSEVSEGCDHCYAKTFAERWRGVPGHPFEQGFHIRLWPDRLGLPLRWRKPKRVFLNSMSDLWHDAVPDEFIAAVWTTMFRTSPDGRPGHWVGAGRHRGGASSMPTHWLRWAAGRRGGRPHVGVLESGVSRVGDDHSAGQALPVRAVRGGGR